MLVKHTKLKDKRQTKITALTPERLELNQKPFAGFGFFLSGF